METGTPRDEGTDHDTASAETGRPGKTREQRYQDTKERGAPGNEGKDTPGQRQTFWTDVLEH